MFWLEALGLLCAPVFFWGGRFIANWIVSQINSGIYRHCSWWIKKARDGNLLLFSGRTQNFYSFECSSSRILPLETQNNKNRNGTFNNGIILPLFPSADNRPVSTTFHLHVHGSRLVARNRIFINLWRLNAENVEVTFAKFIAIYLLQNVEADDSPTIPFFFFYCSTPSCSTCRTINYVLCHIVRAAVFNAFWE